MEAVSKILIVDDKSENIFSLEQILAEVDATLITAKNGNEALIASLNHDFALAILDVQMPDMDGYELAELLRSEKKNRTLPIIFVSAVYSSDYHIFKGYETGAVDFLVKPFDDKILLGKVQVFLNLYRQKHELEYSKNLIRKQYNEYITHRKKLEERLKKANDELEQKVTDRTRELTQKNLELTREIEKRKKAEIAAEKSKNEWKDIFNAIGHMAMILDDDFTIMAVNKTTVEQMGLPIHDLIGKKCDEVIQPSNQMDPHCPLKAFLNQKNRSISGSVVREMHIKNLGKSFIVSCTPIWDTDGKLTKIIHIMTDISERKRLEKDLLQAHKMEAIGTLAGGIAHDFNNILTSILGYTHLIMLDAKEREDILDNAQEVYKAGLRATDLVRQILTFARKTDEEKASIRVDVIVKEVLKLLRSSIPTSIDIQSNIQSKSKVMANATQIHQVIMNLCTNASHAMENREGVLSIELKDTQIDSSQRDLLEKISPGRYLELKVSDTGTGISAEILDRIFEPYFTTKSVDKGTGMGLAMVQSIVGEGGGTIRVQSQPDVGTAFTVLLPITENEKTLPVSPPSVSTQSQGHGHILLVDDEPSITKFGQKLLEKSGYQVTTFNCPMEALRCFETQPDNFDLLMTDLTMPKMRGDALIRKVCAVVPELPCVLITGYGKEIDEATEKLDELKAILIKPLDRDKLLSSIHQLLK